MMKKGFQQILKSRKMIPRTLMAFFSLSICLAFFWAFCRLLLSKAAAAAIRPAFLALGVLLGLLLEFSFSGCSSAEVLAEGWSTKLTVGAPLVLTLVLDDLVQK